MLYFLAHTAELLIVQPTAHGLACGASGSDSQLGRSVRAETAAVAAVCDVSEKYKRRTQPRAHARQHAGFCCARGRVAAVYDAKAACAT
jgi:hypothetical protein